MTTWAEVVVGDVVAGKGGGLWSVVDRSADGQIVLESVSTGARRPGTPNPSAEVVVVIPNTSAEAAAIALTTVVLGGEEIGHRNEDGRWMAPVTFVHTGSALGHLYVFHGVGSAEFTLGQALAEHHRLHTDRVPQVQDHVHDPDYFTGRVKDRAEVAGA